MNYFEFFGIDVSIDIDMNALKDRFYENSRKYHPDFHTLSSDEDKDEALRLSALNNEAFKILKNERKRIKYILELNNLLEEGKNTVPQDFLMDMMEINEALMELQFDPNPTASDDVKSKIAAFILELKKELGAIKNDFPSEQALQDLKDYYLKNQYLKRLLEKID